MSEQNVSLTKKGLSMRAQKLVFKIRGWGGGYSTVQDAKETAIRIGKKIEDVYGEDVGRYVGKDEDLEGISDLIDKLLGIDDPDER